MLSKQSSAMELKEVEERFLSAAHEVKKVRAAARQVWEEEHATALNTKTDGWKQLAERTLPSGDVERPIGREIISALRKHLAGLQGNRCCYCRRWLQNVAHARPIEHILSRKDYPQFSLAYINLALCCRDCNQMKSDDNWSTVEKSATEYPIDIEDFFHPRLHPYDQHIRYVRVESNGVSIAIYHGATEQGRRLCRHHLKKVSQVDALFKNNRQIANVVERLQAAGDTADEVQATRLREFIDALHKSVRRIAGIE